MLTYITGAERNSWIYLCAAHLGGFRSAQVRQLQGTGHSQFPLAQHWEQLPTKIHSLEVEFNLVLNPQLLLNHPWNISNGHEHGFHL